MFEPANAVGVFAARPSGVFVRIGGARAAIPERSASALARDLKPAFGVMTAACFAAPGAAGEPDAARNVGTTAVASAPGTAARVCGGGAGATSAASSISIAGSTSG
ncbi:MAG: hypothetical protein ACYCUE_14435, partial [Steroidobacteraceae bacterium]